MSVSADRALPAPAPARLPLPPAGLIALAGLGLSFIVGALLARNAATGMGVLFALVYAPLVFLNLRMGIAIWIALEMLYFLPGVGSAPVGARIIVIAAGLGILADRRRLRDTFSGPAAVIPLATAALVAWFALSALWAEDVGRVWVRLGDWVLALVAFIVVAAALRTRRDLEVVMGGFVAGVVLSVAVGLALNGLSGSSSAYDSATQSDGRLAGGAGDPNYLAALIVPALAFSATLLRTRRDPLVRLALLCSLVILVVGLGATQSRGGLVAAMACVLAAFALVKGRRVQIAVFVTALLALGGAWFASNPAALERIRTADSGGTGRSELWAVGWRMVEDRPLVGVGLDNYQVLAPDYVRDVGTLRFARLIAEKPHVAHSTYLQALAETGIVGLLLFSLVVGASMRAAWAARRRFLTDGRAEGEAIANGVLIAQIGMLSAAIFLSVGDHGRVWFLLALGPAVLAVAHASSRPEGPRIRD
jgi:O-antigen ligase